MSIPVGHLPVDNGRHTRFMNMERVYQVRRERLREAAEGLCPGHGTQRQLADRLGRDPNYISRLLSAPDKKGHKRIGEELAREFEEKLVRPAYWLDGIEQSDSGIDSIRQPGVENGARDEIEQYAVVPSVGVRYYPDIAASAGHGCLPISEATVLMMRVARSVLERRGVKPDNAALLQADGDSMRGTVGHGDMMLLNLADNEPRDGRVYVVSVGDDVLVKRIQRIPNGIKLIADNPAYDSIALMDEDQDTQVSIVGRVVIAWRAHDLIE